MNTFTILFLLVGIVSAVDFKFSTKLPQGLERTPVFTGVGGFTDPPPPVGCGNCPYYDFCGWNCTWQDGAFERNRPAFDPDYCNALCRYTYAGERPDRVCINPIGAAPASCNKFGIRKCANPAGELNPNKCQQWGPASEATPFFGPFCHHNCTVKSTPNGNPMDTNGVGDPTGLFNSKYTSLYQVRWGEPGYQNEMSGFGFNPEHDKIMPINQEFRLGQMVHYNHPIYDPANKFSLTMILSIWPDGNANNIVARQTYSFDFFLDETPNRKVQAACKNVPGHDSKIDTDPDTYVCPYKSNLGPLNCDISGPPFKNFPECPDKINTTQAVNPNVSFKLNNIEYTLILTGFRGGQSTTTSPAFLSEENGVTVVDLFGIITLKCPTCADGKAPVYNATTGVCGCVCPPPDCPPGWEKSADCSQCVCPKSTCTGGATPQNITVAGVTKCGCNCTTITCPPRQIMTGASVIDPATGTCGTCKCDTSLCNAGTTSNDTACSCICDATKCPGVSTGNALVSSYTQTSDCKCNCVYNGGNCGVQKKFKPPCDCECVYSTCPNTGFNYFVKDNSTCNCACDTVKLAATCKALGRDPDYDAFNLINNTGRCQCKPCVANFTDNGLDKACVCQITDAQCRAAKGAYYKADQATCTCVCDPAAVTAGCAAWNVKPNSTAPSCGCTPCTSLSDCCDAKVTQAQCLAKYQNRVQNTTHCECGPCIPDYAKDQNGNCVCAKAASTCLPPTYNASTMSTFWVVNNTSCKCQCDLSKVQCSFPTPILDASICGCKPSTDNKQYCKDVLNMPTICAARNMNYTATDSSCNCTNCLGDWKVGTNATVCDSCPLTTQVCTDRYYNASAGIIENKTVVDLASCSCKCPTFSCADPTKCVGSSLSTCGCLSTTCNCNVTQKRQECLALARDAIFDSTNCGCSNCLYNFTGGTNTSQACVCAITAASCGANGTFNATTCECGPCTVDCTKMGAIWTRDLTKPCDCRTCVGSECASVCATKQAECQSKGMVWKYDPTTTPPTCECEPCKLNSTICAQNGTNHQFDASTCTCKCPTTFTCPAWNQRANTTESVCKCVNCTGPTDCAPLCTDSFNQTYCNSINRGFAVNATFCGCTDCLGNFTALTTPLQANTKCDQCILKCNNQEIVDTAAGACKCKCEELQINCTEPCRIADVTTCGCKNDTASCFCGNGIVDAWAGEQCDPGKNGTDVCCNPATCRWRTFNESCSVDPCLEPGTCVDSATANGKKVCNQTVQKCNDYPNAKGCSTTKCVPTATGFSCVATPVADGLKCPGGNLSICDEQCISGVCVSKPTVCTSANVSVPCTLPCCLPTCNTTTGTCEPKWLENNTCSDLNVCTANDMCKPNPDATNSTKLICKGDIQCTDSSNSQGLAVRECFNITCNQVGRCVSQITPNVPCNGAQNPCMVDKQCTELGACMGPQKECPTYDECTYTLCSLTGATRGSCVNASAAFTHFKKCNDGNNCTINDRCINKTCVGGPVNKSIEGCDNTTATPIWPIGVSAGVVGLAAAVAAALVAAKANAANLADPVTWGEYAGQGFEANPLYTDKTVMGDNPLYGQ